MYKLLLGFASLALILALPLPLNEYSYLLARNQVKLLDINETYLSSIEKRVSIYFEKVKADEFEKTSSSIISTNWGCARADSGFECLWPA